MKCFRPSILSLALLLSISSSSLLAGSPSPEGQGESGFEFSMENVLILKMRGGNYWMGFFLYTIDLEKAEMHASWNRLDCSMKKAEGSAKLSPEDIARIKVAVEGLQYEPLDEDGPCYLMADGDESSLRLLQDLDDQKAPSYYPMKSWHSRCEGRPITNESYLKIEKEVFGILPQPETKESWMEVDPKFACSSEVKNSP